MTRHLLGSHLRFLRPILPAAILMFGLGLTHPVQGATLFVATNGNNVGNCQSGPCMTITYAIGQANLTGDTISVTMGPYNPSLGEVFPLTINKNLAITGAGAGSTILDATGANQRVITINSGFTVTISGVTITGGISLPIGPSGSGPGGGGGIRNDGTLTLDNSTVTSNGGGGGVFNSGILILNNSTVSNNKGAGGIFNMRTITLNNSTVSGNNGGNSVGGIYNFFGTSTLNNSSVSGNTAFGIGGIRNTTGTVTLTNSTVSGNSASQNQAGGIYNDCGDVTLTNSTVSGNSAVSQGGGIVNSFQLAGSGYCPRKVATVTLTNSTVSGNGVSNGPGGGIFNQFAGGGNATVTVTLNNSTVSGNSATTGGGIFNGGSVVKLKNSIVASNTGSPGANCSGTMTSLGHNIADDASCGLTGTGDMSNTNPVLGPLANNGGPTLTLTPQLGSAAIDGVPLANCTDANNAAIATDQRGVTRPQGAACDIGSVEFQMQTFEYAVKFVCGRTAGTATSPPPVATGFYFTAINVHNPNSGPISFTKKFARALTKQTAGAVSQFFPAALRSDEAFEVECGEITNKLQLAPLTFVTGFAVFQSVQELDIVAVYTAAANVGGPVVTMHTERVPKRP